MKDVLKLCMVFLMTSLITLQAHSRVQTDEPAPIDEVRKEIIRLIGQPDLQGIYEKKMESTLHFMVTPKKELVVLMVDTKHEFLDRYLKRKLNYRKVPVSEVAGRYAMKITLKNGSS